MIQYVKCPTEPGQFSSGCDDFYKDFVLLSICFQFSVLETGASLVHLILLIGIQDSVLNKSFTQPYS
jgi:hypothetical protein